MSTDLFGEEVVEPIISERTGKAKRRTVPKGYARQPGSGPAGETCGTCDHCVRVEHNTKAYHKCAVVRHRWTHGPGSDILRASPACEKWTPFVEPVPPAGYRWLRVNEILRAGDVWNFRGDELLPVSEPVNGARVTADCRYHVARPIAHEAR